MKSFQERFAGPRWRAVLWNVMPLLVALLIVFGMRLGQAWAADPSPQGVTAYVNSTLFTYNGITQTTLNATGLGVVAPGFALGDCYNSIAFASAVVNTTTTKIQSSVDNINWVDTQSFIDITNTTEMSRVVLYGYYTRAAVTSIFTTAVPLTGTVICTFKNLK